MGHTLATQPSSHFGCQAATFKRNNSYKSGACWWRLESKHIEESNWNLHQNIPKQSCDVKKKLLNLLATLSALLYQNFSMLGLWPVACAAIISRVSSAALPSLRCTHPPVAKLYSTHYVATVAGIWQHLWLHSKHETPQTSTMSMTLPMQSGCFHASVKLKEPSRRGWKKATTDWLIAPELHQPVVSHDRT